MNATITYGRNVGASPMSDEEWQAFRAAILGLVGQVYTDATTVGEWQGVPEESGIVLGTVDDADHLRTELAAVATRFAQDAIGLTLGEGELVS